MTCDDVRISLGAYVLGALDDEESAEVEAHLDGCPGCLAELRELSGLPPLLARVSAEDVEHAAAPPRAVLDRLLASSARRRRRSRVLLTLAASAAVVALGGTAWLAAGQGVPQSASSAADGQVAVTMASRAPQAGVDHIMVAPAESPAASAAPGAARKQASSQPRSQEQPSSQARPRSQGQPPPLTARSGAVRMELRLTPEAGGARITADIWGVPAGTACVLRAVAADGTVTRVASWSVGPKTYGTEEKTTFEGSTSLDTAQVRRFELGTPDGRTLVAVTV